MSDSKSKTSIPTEAAPSDIASTKCSCAHGLGRAQQPTAVSQFKTSDNVVAMGPSKRGPWVDPDSNGIDPDHRLHPDASDDPNAGLLRAALAEFVADHRDRCRADARMLQVLSGVYAIAYERAEAKASTGSSDFLRALNWQLRSVTSEFALPVNDSEYSVENQLMHAHDIITKFPEWVDAVASAKVKLAHTHGIVAPSYKLQPEQFPEYSRRVLEYAYSNTPRKTRLFAEKLANELCPEEEVTAAFKRAAEDRGVEIWHGYDGMSTLSVHLPTHLAQPIHDLLILQARELKKLAAQDPTNTDERTIHQICADLFADTMLTSTPTAALEGENGGLPRIKAIVSVTMPVLSLLDNHGTAASDGTAAHDGAADAGAGNGFGTGARTATLNGLHPMSVEDARRYAGEVPELQRVLTHPVTGHLIEVDTYKPDASLRRFLRVRDQTCRFPGCNRAAAGSDLDHTVPFSVGGKTSDTNMAHLCRRHHVQKHFKPWKVEQLPGGVLKWTTPLGQVATTAPEPVAPAFKPTATTQPPGPPDAPPGRHGPRALATSAVNGSSLPVAEFFDDPPPF